jgi:integrase
MDVSDIYTKNRRLWIRLHEKGGRYHEMPLHHNAETYLTEYIEAAKIKTKKDTPLFRTLDRRRRLTTTRMLRQDAWGMIRRRAKQAGVNPEICNHTFRATGITEYMRGGGTLEKAQQMAAHASSRTTNIYNRTQDEVHLDEVEKIHI